MKVKLQLNKFYISEWYYILVMIGYVLTLVSGNIHPGVIASVLLLLIYLETIRERGYTLKSTLDILMVIYFAYHCLSGIWCVLYGTPISVFLGEFSTGALPMIFYFVGRCVGDRIDSFYRKFIYAVLIVGTVGFILYLTAPQFYLDYLYRLQLISKADAGTMRIRMISVIGSILMGYVSVAAMLASAHILLNTRGKKGKVFIFVNCFFAFMSNQRSAMVVAILVLIYVNLLVFFTFKILPVKYLIRECAALIGGFGVLCVLYFQAILKVYYRLVSLPGAIGQRSDSWVGAINNMKNLWLGNGLGANGHRAAGYTDHMIADGGLAKMFCELGIIGMSVFIFMMILLFRKGSRHLMECAAELGIIAITLLQSIGSNMLEFQLATPIFWFAVGRVAMIIWKEEKPSL